MATLSWHLCNRVVTFDSRPLIMGIVNVTPDSFSDGGQFFDPAQAIEHGLKLAADGADILDVGGESTRPGATPVPVDEELKRVVPVIRELARQTNVLISIDTMKGAVAAAAIEAGAHIVNDVTALRDPETVRVCAKTDVGIILMHMQGTPQTMQANPSYTNVVSDTVEYLQERIAALGEAGIAAERIVIDPGIGFGKTFSQTMQQLRRLNEYIKLGRPLCLGVSRKGFIGQITGRERPQRLAGTLAANCFAVASGSAHILRVHDVAEHRDAVKMWEAIQSSVSRND
jgi:dihydropteroate synthase